MSVQLKSRSEPSGLVPGQGEVGDFFTEVFGAAKRHSPSGPMLVVPLQQRRVHRLLRKRRRDFLPALRLPDQRSRVRPNQSPASVIEDSNALGGKSIQKRPGEIELGTTAAAASAYADPDGHSTAIRTRPYRGSGACDEAKQLASEGIDRRKLPEAQRAVIAAA